METKPHSSKSMAAQRILIHTLAAIFFGSMFVTSLPVHAVFRVAWLILGAVWLHEYGHDWAARIMGASTQWNWGSMLRMQPSIDITWPEGVTPSNRSVAFVKLAAAPLALAYGFAMFTWPGLIFAALLSIHDIHDTIKLRKENVATDAATS